MTNLSDPAGYAASADENELHGLIASARVVIFCSNLTDVRPILARLNRLGVPYRQVIMGMGSMHMRQRFHALESFTGWHQLPQIFVDRQFLGGYEEFFAHDFRVPLDRMAPIPAPAWWFGGGGLIPFVAGATGLWLAPPAWHAQILGALLSYAAIILSFIGAVHWGLALRERQNLPELWWRLGLSVTPALIAWLVLMMPPLPAVGMLALLFGVTYLVDYSVLGGLAPEWYRQLRAWLSTGATLSLLAALLAVSLQGAPLMAGYILENSDGQGAHGEHGIGAALAEPLRAPHRSIIF
ncbi:MAG: DUF3429 family protein [Gammaproteobacteria bacterium]|nr:DUF3429 family protein [Gammaproteobacteria bacterium]